MSEKTWTVRITNSCENVLLRVQEAWQSLFGVEAKLISRFGEGWTDVAVSSKTIVEFLQYLGCGRVSREKRIPDAVMRSPRPMVLSFLQGLALDAWTSRDLIRWGITLNAEKCIDDLQAVLTNLGVVHSRTKSFNAKYDSWYFTLLVDGVEAQKLMRWVPFLESDKAVAAELCLSRVQKTGSTADVVPGIAGRDLYARTARVSRRTVERVAAVPGAQLLDWLRLVVDRGLHFSPVTEVSDAGEQPVYDISVPGARSFVGNGVVSHNTVNLPATATVEEIEEIHFEAWRLGLKAVAVYRDGCKAAQPLASGGSSQKEDDAVAKIAEPVVESPHGVPPVRHRLPARRPAVTTSFSVGGAEGYLTSGSYPGNGLGEIFLKLGKQGSTLAGVMDAFSISISIGLQYGIPLSAFVEKFIGMQFEPRGMTNDPDVSIASSVLDYVVRRLALDHLPADERELLGVQSTDERTAPRTPVADHVGKEAPLSS